MVRNHSGKLDRALRELILNQYKPFKWTPCFMHKLMVQIVEKAWEAGIVVCVAAGNEGPDNGTIASPGISDLVITVGALDDNVADFSSRGPTKYKDKNEPNQFVTKPDLLALGVNIISLRSPNSYLDKLQKGSRVEVDYCVLSGTSMATPICAGVVALMK